MENIKFLCSIYASIFTSFLGLILERSFPVQAQCNYINWMKFPCFLLVGSHLFVSSLFTKNPVSAFRSSWSTSIHNSVTKSLPSSSLQDLYLKHNGHSFNFGLKHERLQRLGPFFHKSWHSP